MNNIYKVFAALTFCVFASSGIAEIRTVSNNSELSAALNNAAVDTILIAPGEYQPIKIHRKVTLQSTNIDQWISYFNDFRNQARTNVYMLRDKNALSAFYLKAKDMLPHFRGGTPASIDIRNAGNSTAADVHIRGVFIEDFGTNGVRVAIGSSKVSVEYSVMRSPGGNQGVMMQSVTNSSVLDSFFEGMHHNRPHCIYFSESYSDNNVAAGNICINIGGHSIQFNAEDNKGNHRALQAVIADNIILDSHALMNLCGVVDGIVSNNLAINVTKGMDVGGGGGCVKSSGNKILHNTIIAINNVQTSFLDGNTAVNNIFYGNNAPQPCRNIASGCSSKSQPAMDQLFQNATVGDFRPKSVSMAIDSGETSIITDDIMGALRPAGSGPDMGAFELNSSNPNPTPTPADPAVTPTPVPTGPTEETPTISQLTIEGKPKMGSDAAEITLKIGRKKWNRVQGAIALDSPVSKGSLSVTLSSSDESMLKLPMSSVMVKKSAKKNHFAVLLKTPSCAGGTAALTATIGSSSRSLQVHLKPVAKNCHD